MSIWNFQAATSYEESGGQCHYCHCALVELPSRLDSYYSHGIRSSSHDTISACPNCGWWLFSRLHHYSHQLGHIYSYYGASALLKQLDIRDFSLPIQDIRDYLSVNYGDRFHVNPRRFEEVVASVFHDHGYKTLVTQYSGDDGIDVILGTGDSAVGVQVKRYGSAIQVEQIRALAGALVFHGITKGVFVTTTKFQSGAPRTVAEFAKRGLYIELHDATRFLGALGIAQREMFEFREDINPGRWSDSLKPIKEEWFDRDIDFS
jgi:restriction system protein